MKKREMAYASIIFLSVCLFAVFVDDARADYGGATVSWVAPTTDEGGGALTGLTGYRVYYSTSSINCTNWNAADQATRSAGTVSGFPAAYRSVSGGSALTYTFSNTTYLTPGSTYNFAVVATDGTNLSNCATGTGGVTSVGKAVSYSADINSDHKVDYLDYGLFHPYYNGSNAGADFDKSGTVDYLDYGILHTDYNKSF